MNLHVDLDYDKVLVDAAQPLHLAIRFVANERAGQRRDPIALALVVDQSGSMAGDPLAAARDACRIVAKNLRDEDQVAVVLFGSQAQTLVPLRTPGDRQELGDAIDRIEAHGGTNLAGGWMLGRDALRGARQGAPRKVVLLTDGHLNTGITDLPTIRAMVQAARDQEGIRTSTLGFGDHYDEEFLAEVAMASSGTFYDADSPEKLPAIFATELSGLQALTAQNIRVRLKRLDFCDGAEPISELPHVTLTDGRDEWTVGDLVSKEERVIVLKLQTCPLPLGADGKPVASLDGEQLVELEVVWDELTDEGVISKSHRQIVRIQPTQNAAEIAVNESVLPWVALQTAGRAVGNARDLMKSMKTAEALAAIQAALEVLRRFEKPDAVADGMRALEAFAEIIQTRKWTQREQKSATYYSNYSKVSGGGVSFFGDEKLRPSKTK